MKPTIYIQAIPPDAGQPKTFIARGKEDVDDLTLKFKTGVPLLTADAARKELIENSPDVFDLDCPVAPWNNQWEDDE